MGDPRFSFAVQIDAFSDEVPGAASVRQLVSSGVRVSFAGAEAPGEGSPLTFTYATETGWPGPVPVQVLVVRTTRSQVVSGTITEHNGQWQWSGGGRVVPLAANNPCVTRVWPGGHGMTEHEYDEFCKTLIVEPPVPPGIAGTVNFSYDLSTGAVAGDVNGAAGQPFSIQRAVPSGGAFDLSFTVLAEDMRRFARDIAPLFRPVDVQHMRPQFDPTRYEDVKTFAVAINLAVNASPTSGGRMPPQPDAPWPPGYKLVFKQWMDQGMQP
ncbi:MAG TPA: hypothetical protein VKY26_13135 [Actinomycetota bacterium]|nr:hypothetical protein [Actinomycetota bacterium]